MRSKARTSDSKKLIKEIKSRQDNIVWPGPLINSRGVDELLWKGSSNAPLIQRMGACIFGVAFIVVGIVWISIAYEKGGWLFGVGSIVNFLIGGMFVLNGLRRRKSKNSKTK